MITRLKQSLSSRPLRLFLSVLIAGLSLYLAIRDVSYEEVKGAYQNAELALAGWALVSVAGTNVGKAARWKVLMGSRGKLLSLKQSFMVILAAQALNKIYPARVGDLSRVNAVGSSGPGRVFVLGTVVVEKLIDMALYALLFLALFLLMPIPEWINQSAVSFILAAFAGLGLVVLVTRRLDWTSQLVEKVINLFPAQLRPHGQDWLRSGLASLQVLKSPGDVVKIGFWSLLIWSTAVLTNYLTLLALDIQLPLTAPILVLIVLQISMSIPAVPGSIGIFEYLCILSLAVFGIPQAQGLSYGLLLHFIALLPQTLLGLVFVGILGPGQNKVARANDQENLVELAERAIGEE